MSCYESGVVIGDEVVGWVGFLLWKAWKFISVMG